tara:strand:+ start:50 stop:259 length:210 start_codon:yes stop_codon:yes gene_type:complete
METTTTVKNDKDAADAKTFTTVNLTERVEDESHETEEEGWVIVYKSDIEDYPPIGKKRRRKQNVPMKVR